MTGGARGKVLMSVVLSVLSARYMRTCALFPLSKENFVTAKNRGRECVFFPGKRRCCCVVSGREFWTLGCG